MSMSQCRASIQNTDRNTILLARQGSSVVGAANHIQLDLAQNLRQQISCLEAENALLKNKIQQAISIAPRSKRASVVQIVEAVDSVIDVKIQDRAFFSNLDPNRRGSDFLNSPAGLQHDALTRRALELEKEVADLRAKYTQRYSKRASVVGGKYDLNRGNKDDSGKGVCGAYIEEGEREEEVEGAGFSQKAPSLLTGLWEDRGAQQRERVEGRKTSSFTSAINLAAGGVGVGKHTIGAFNAMTTFPFSNKPQRALGLIETNITETPGTTILTDRYPPLHSFTVDANMSLSRAFAPPLNGHHSDAQYGGMERLEGLLREIETFKEQQVAEMVAMQQRLEELQMEEKIQEELEVNERNEKKVWEEGDIGNVNASNKMQGERKELGESEIKKDVKVNEAMGKRDEPLTSQQFVVTAIQKKNSFKKKMSYDSILEELGILKEQLHHASEENQNLEKEYNAVRNKLESDQEAQHLFDFQEVDRACEFQMNLMRIPVEKKRLKQLEENINNMTASEAKKRYGAQQANAEAEKLKKDLTEAIGQRLEAEMQIMDMEGKTTDAQNRLIALQESIKTILAERDFLRLQLQRLEKKKMPLEREVDSLVRSRDGNASTIRLLEEQQCGYLYEREDIQRKCKAQQRISNNLCETVGTNNIQGLDVSQATDALRTEREQLLRQLDILEGDYKDIKNKYKLLRNNVNSRQDVEKQLRETMVHLDKAKRDIRNVLSHQVQVTEQSDKTAQEIPDVIKVVEDVQGRQRRLKSEQQAGGSGYEMEERQMAPENVTVAKVLAQSGGIEHNSLVNNSKVESKKF